VKPWRASLGGRVVGLPELALLAIHRGDVDDAAPALLEHVVDDLLGDVEQAVEIRLDDLVPLLVGHLAEQAVARDAGVVDQHVRGTVLGPDSLEGRLGRVPVRDVALRRVHLVALRVHFGEPAVLAGRSRAATGDDFEAGLAETLRDGRADAAHAAGHVGDFSRVGHVACS
jgi:hypothetical protein